MRRRRTYRPPRVISFPRRPPPFPRRVPGQEHPEYALGPPLPHALLRFPRFFSPALRNREFARNAARSASSANSLFRRAGEIRLAENDACRQAPFLYLSIRFSTFALRRLLADVFSSHASLDEWESPKRKDRGTAPRHRNSLGGEPLELSTALSID